MDLEERLSLSIELVKALKAQGKGRSIREVMLLVGAIRRGEVTLPSKGESHARRRGRTKDSGGRGGEGA